MAEDWLDESGTECGEVAESVYRAMEPGARAALLRFDDALKIARREVGDQGETIISRVARALLNLHVALARG